MFNINRVLYKFNRVSGRVKISTTDVLGYHHMYQEPSSLISVNPILFSQNFPLEIFSFYKHESNTEVQLHGEGSCCDDSIQDMRVGFHESDELDCGLLQLSHHVVWQVVTRVHQNICNHLPLTAYDVITQKTPNPPMTCLQDCFQQLYA